MRVLVSITRLEQYGQDSVHAHIYLVFTLYVTCDKMYYAIVPQLVSKLESYWLG